MPSGTEPSGHGGAASRRRAWRDVAVAALSVALLALLFNVTFPAEINGELQGSSFVRKTVSKVLSSGTVWAGLSVYAGWRLRRPVQSMVAGVLAAQGSLLAHYLLGMALGMYGPHILEENYAWFVAGVILCAPLGWCGYLASRPGRLGLGARLLVPLGAVLEPLVTRKFVPAPLPIPWPEALSNVVSGALLLLLGVVLGVVVLRRGRGGGGRGPAPWERRGTRSRPNVTSCRRSLRPVVRGSLLRLPGPANPCTART